jgi:hypothetical protein
MINIFYYLSKILYPMNDIQSPRKHITSELNGLQNPYLHQHLSKPTNTYKTPECIGLCNPYLNKSINRK